MGVENLEIQNISAYYGYHDAPGTIMILKGDQQTTQHIHQRPFRAAHFTILMTVKGTVNFKINLTQFLIRENELIVIPPAAIRELSLASPDTEFIALFFTSQYLFNTGFYKKHFKLFRFFDDDYQPNVYPDQQAVGIIRSMLELLSLKILEKSKDNASAEITQLLFQSFLLELSLINEKSKDMRMEHQRNGKDDLAVRFLRLLPQYYRMEREISFYANKLFVNPKYLSQTLKASTGKTARQYIVEMITLDAQILLDNPSLSIGQIAEELKFSDQFHFSHFFKKYTGTTPSQYRIGKR
ncbi:helix-turn-helix domain-containing protein [Chitinophaga sancti]|uniref:helix-turn-helix domain-containing protein n=1 Tax=Chitinophaga sancti TaxID=1004 RepID=UPI002A76554F|nr:helix-turn-helix domain-containing protein [Chitinophaga sancti]WPQ61756.1 helix-turn-helix domain-containing protein [Chitinophaga sancti]